MFNTNSIPIHGMKHETSLHSQMEWCFYTSRYLKFSYGILCLLSQERINCLFQGLLLRTATFYFFGLCEKTVAHLSFLASGFRDRSRQLVQLDPETANLEI